MLAEYGDVTRVALCDYLGPREPRRHLYNLVADYPSRGGRMLRPSLCIAMARATAERQVILAGRRLADRVKKLLSAK